MEEIKSHTTAGYIKKISQGINRNTIKRIIVCRMYLEEFQQNTLKSHHKMAGTDSGAQFKYSKARKTILWPRDLICKMPIHIAKRSQQEMQQ